MFQPGHNPGYWSLLSFISLVLYTAVKHNGMVLACTDDADCLSIPDQICLAGTCVCSGGLTFEDGSCNSVLGRSCNVSGSYTDCLAIGTVCGPNLTCNCIPGAYQDGGNGTCYQIDMGYGFTSCSSDDNCTIPGTACQYGFCVCRPGMALDGVSCTSVLGTTCNVSGSYTDCLAIGTVCGPNLTCSCIPGMFQDGGDGMCNQTDAFYGLTSCTSDDNCTMPDTACLYGFCYCQPGLSFDGVSCTSVLGTPCNKYGSYEYCVALGTVCDLNHTCSCIPGAYQDGGDGICYQTDLTYGITSCSNDANCTMPGTACQYGICYCRPGLSFDGSYCASVLGTPCNESESYTDCLAIGTVCDMNHTCSCIPWAYKDGGDGICYPANTTYDITSCSSDGDCTMSGTVCLYGYCNCRPGFDFGGEYCTSVIGQGCTSTVECLALGTSCNNASSMCECDPTGWVLDTDGLGCAFAHNISTNSSCSADYDCLMPEQRCLYGFCTCRPGYTTEYGACISVIGRTCMIASKSPSADCLAEGTWCNHFSMCDCNPTGWTLDAGGLGCIEGSNSSCYVDGDCQLPGETCRYGSCACRPGHTYESGICTSVIGRICSSSYAYGSAECTAEGTWCGDIACECNPAGWILDIDGLSCTGAHNNSTNTSCSSDYDCLMPEQRCLYGICTCRPGYTTEHGACISVIGRTCTFASESPSADCLAEGTWCNHLSMCDCDPTGWMLDAGGFGCTEGSNSSCYVDGDCQLLGETCRYGVCACRPGHTYESGICTSDIGKICSPSYAYGSQECTAEGTWCGDMACECDPEGWILDTDGLSCTEAHNNSTNSSCYSDYDCLMPEQRCLNGFCSCRPGYTTEYGACTSVIGRTCVSPFTYGSSDCPAEGTWCGDMECECDPLGWILNTDGFGCSEINAGLNSSCYVDGDCQQPDQTCRYGICGCRPGYTNESGICASVLGRPCSSPGMSVPPACLAEGVWCNYDMVCECDPTGWIADAAWLGCTDAINGSYAGSNSSCVTDADCTVPDQRCQYGVCTCQPGYTYEFGLCSLAHNISTNLSCSADYDCLMPEQRCLYGFCTCRPGYTTEYGACISVIGRTCTIASESPSADCLAEGTWCNHLSMCDCDPTGWMLDAGGFGCTEGSNSTCNADGDCQLPGETCRHGVCACRPGHTYESGICTSDIGRICSPSYAYGSQECTAEGTWCGDMACECDPEGWILDTDGLSCTEAHNNSTNSSCYSDYDCLMPEQRCLNGFCSCSPGYTTEYDACISVIGRTCVSPFTYGSSDCPAEGTWCGDMECECDPLGWILNTDRFGCSEMNTGLNSTCFVDGDCQLPDQTCRYGICGCRPGYTNESGICTSVLGRSCSSPGMSVPAACLAEGVWCNNDMVCECDPTGWIADAAWLGCTDAFIGSYGGSNSSCINDANCTIPDQRCQDGVCACQPGYTYEFGVCSSDVFSACTDDADCSIIPDQMCIGGICMCKAGLKLDYIYGSCNSVLGTPCNVSGSYTSCLAIGTVCDQNRTCSCIPRAFQDGGDGICYPMYEGSITTCSTDANCTMPDFVCRYGFCYCRPGFLFDGTNCNSVIGQACTTPNVRPSMDCLAEGMWCNNASMCDCDPAGWMLDTDGLGCTEAYTGSYPGSNSSCVTDEDCQRPAQKCQNGACACRPGYTDEFGVCSLVVGRTCATPGLHMATECTAEGTWCGEFSVCECDPAGWVLDVDEFGCIEGLNLSCYVDGDCQQPNQTCRYGICGCRPGYTNESGICISVIGKPCIVPGIHISPECPAEGTWCGDSMMCECDPDGWVLDTIGFGCTYVYDGSYAGSNSSCVADADCTIPDQRCLFGVCACHPGYKYEFGVCISVIGNTCSNPYANESPECLAEGTWCSGVMVCECDPAGWTSTSDGLSCTEMNTGLNSSCYVDGDCQQPDQTCRYGICGCRPGYTNEFGTCISVMGRSCTDPGTHVSPECLAEGTWCGDSMMCDCDPDGWILDATGLGCTDAYNGSYAASNSSCVADADCPLPDQRCLVGVCACQPGFKYEFGVCSSDVFSACTNDADCSLISDQMCIGGICMCKGGMKLDFMHGTCNSVLGTPCNVSGSYTDCLGIGTVCDQNQTCSCISGVFQDGGDGICYSMFTGSITTCSTDANCTLPDFVCRYGFCYCRPGFLFDGTTCNSLIGQACITPNERPSTDCLAEGMWCNHASVCDCDPAGWMLDTDGLGCTEAYTGSYPGSNSSCITDADCQMPDQRCQNGVCACRPGYTDEFGACISVVGRSCATPGVHVAAECLAEGTWCSDVFVCECDPAGWILDADGLGCVEVPVTAAEAITDTQCDQSVSGECEAKFGPAVVCGSLGFCACASENFVAVEYQCIHECALEGQALHDTSRRLTSYQRVLGEPIVTDRHIVEGWYSLGQHRLAGPAIIENLQPGACGTKYRIGLKDGTTVDWDSLDLTEVVATATVYDRPEGRSEDLEIKVRQCENDIQYYLRPTQIRLAAYCFDSADEMNGTFAEDAPSAGSYQNYVSVQASLSFREEYRDNILFDVPYVAWSCDAQGYINQVSNFPDAQFITVSWFATNDLIKRSQPTLIGQWTQMNLTEFDLLDAGYSLGVVIRCGIQVSKSATGKLSSMTTALFDTNLFSNVQSATGEGSSELSVNNDHNLLQVLNTVPIGCAAPVGTTTENCTIKLHFSSEAGSTACSNSIAKSDEHELCGLTLFGLTKYGFERNYFYYNPWNFLQRYHLNDNGTYVSENIGTHVILDSTSVETDSDAALYLNMAVGTNGAGHELWDNYEIHNAQIYLSDGNDRKSGSHSCSISHEYIQSLGQNGAVINRNVDIYPLYSYQQLLLEGPGKYILMRSGRFPFSFEIEVEYNTDGQLYVCGGYLQYGNDIYAYSMCGGDFVEGLVYGDGNNQPEIATSGHRTLKELGITMDTYFEGSQLSIAFNSDSDFAEEFEGSCAFGVNEMIGRDGNIYNQSADFLQSWRIENPESLSNPENHIDYDCESKYYTCGCPAKTDVIPGRDVVFESQWSIQENVYTGAFRCNLDDVCSDVSAGAEWPKSLRPDYLIDEVEVVVEQRLDGFGEPVLWLTCLFRTVDTKLYTVVWYVNKFFGCKIVCQGQYVDFTHPIDNVQDKIKCSASVLDADLTVLISPIMSQDFQLIQLGSTYINMQRGGTGVITWTNHIPFLCTGGYTSCDMEIQFYDPHDAYDCEDSTVAIKSEDHCGGRVHATSTVPATTPTSVTTIFTTKNNDKYMLRSYFELRAMVIFHGAGTTYWTRALKTELTVSIVDEVYWIGQSCHLHPDPHARSLDGKYYEMQHVGLFVFLRHQALPIEIQTVTMPCWTGWGWGGWTPTCSCAIIIRAGADIYVINHCDNNHITGFLSAGDGIIEVYNRDDIRYQVILPTTTMIDIYVMPFFNYFMNIDIYPSQTDKQSIVGLCGNFNGDYVDDLGIRDSATLDNNDEDAFSQSWELLGTNLWDSESLLEEANYLNPTPWNVEEKLCVCPNAATAPFDSTPLCSANEEQTCASQLHEGTKLETETRPKRDTGGHIDLDMKQRVKRLNAFIFEQHEIHRRKRQVSSNVTSLENATILCQQAFNDDCPVSNIISNMTEKPLEDEQYDGYLQDCVKDVMASGDIKWSKGHCTAMTTKTEVEVKKNVEFAQNNTQVVEEMKKLCTGNCNGHGTCTDGVCHCDSQWGRKGCILDRSVVTEISYITGGGLCKLEENECSDFMIVTTGLDVTFKAKIFVQEAFADGIFTQVDEYICEFEAFSFNEAVVSVTCGRRRRATTTKSVLANKYGVAVSNDGVNFGNVTYVTVLDTRCQESTNNSDGETIVVLMAGYCYIGGQCYNEGDANSDTSCQICRSATNTFDWTEENCPTTTSDDNDLPAYVIVLPVCGAVVIMFIIAGLVYLKCIHKQRPVSPGPPPPYRDPAPQTPLNLRFYLKEVATEPFDQEKGWNTKY